MVVTNLLRAPAGRDQADLARGAGNAALAITRRLVDRTPLARRENIPEIVHRSHPICDEMQFNEPRRR